MITALPMPTWVEDAVCATIDPETFFPEKGARPDAAKAICAGCHVRDACLQWALDTRQRFGVWGGTTATERRSLLGDPPELDKDRTDLDEAEDDVDDPIAGRHGTYAGYRAHAKHDIPQCERCKAAHADRARKILAARNARGAEQSAETNALLDAFARHLDEGHAPVVAAQMAGAGSLNAVAVAARRHGRPELGRIADNARRSNGGAPDAEAAALAAVNATDDEATAAAARRALLTAANPVRRAS